MDASSPPAHLGASAEAAAAKKLNQLLASDFCKGVLAEKHALPTEAQGPGDVRHAVQSRVARALDGGDDAAFARFLAAMEDGFVPGGRINRAAGAGNKATMINCFVQPIADSISGDATQHGGAPGIGIAMLEAAETMRRGGGVGYDFSPLRPRGAAVKGTDSRASGPVSYMRMFDAMCMTVESAGARRGAQMGILRIDHPDIIEFIDAKRPASMEQMGLTEQRHRQQLDALMRGSDAFAWNMRSAFAPLRNFNLSVAVTDAFMRAVEADGEFELVHAVAPADRPATLRKAAGADGADVYVYTTVRARDLWERIMRNTYEGAEPGIVFIDAINSGNNLRYVERLAATNPCVTADTWVMTTEGPAQVSDLVGRPFAAVVDGRAYALESQGFFLTGTKPVLRLRTREGHQLRLTADHRVRRVARKTRHCLEVEWTQAARLQPGDEVVLHDHRPFQGWDGAGTQQEGYLLGLLIGDGTLKADKAVISVWAPELKAVGQCAPFYAATGSAGIMQAAADAAATLTHRADFRGFQRPVQGQGEVRMASGALRQLALRLDMAPGRKTITAAMERQSSAFAQGLLRGLFDSDGSVQGAQDKGLSVRLSQSDAPLLQTVQRMLLRLGIASTLYRDRRPAGIHTLPNGKGGQQEHSTRACHELAISGDNLAVFAERVGFCDTDKLARLDEGLASYRRSLNRERFTATVDGLEDDGIEAVYDVTVADVHAFDANGLVVHNCGEQPLPPYGCCDLGSINLSRFVLDPFTPQARVNMLALTQRVVPAAVEILDRVLDTTAWPVPQQRAEAMSKRRIGLGFMGLADLLVKMGLKYSSPEGRALAGEVAQAISHAAYAASVALAKRLGPFPLFDADQYLAEGTFASRLPDALKADIREHGIRNSHLLSIAPTGTISIAFGDNCSGGLEPIFSIEQKRTKIMADGSRESFVLRNAAAQEYEDLTGLRAVDNPVFETANQLSAGEHLAMVAAIAPHVDAAISKTVNVPADYPFEDFKSLYLDAWRSGLKGITTYRPNMMVGAVLADAADAKAESAQGPDAATDPDRRVKLNTSFRVSDHLRYAHRPATPRGALAHVYPLAHPLGDFAVAVSHQLDPEHGRVQPLDVYVAGAEQPRALAALAKMLSVDMREEDPGWISMKLASLARTEGADAFEMIHPETLKTVRMPSLVAGFATVVMHQLKQLGALGDPEQSPMIQALFSRREPKTGPRGSLGWSVDVLNPVTGDDFLLYTKDIELADGTVRPYSMWIQGTYPPALTGLAKSLSIDMRVSDPRWIVYKLRKLLSMSEAQGSFMAPSPDGRQQTYTSTVAYVATLLLHRYDALGLNASTGEHSATPSAVGKQCPSCHALTLHKRDGCETCENCGYMGSCG